MAIQQIFNIKSTDRLFSEQRHGIHGFKKSTKSFPQKTGGNQKLHIKKIISSMHRLDKNNPRKTI